MNNIFKGLIAGYGANKLGGGCLGTIIVFVIIWLIIGNCCTPLPIDSLNKIYLVVPSRIELLSRV